jgi:mRNA interferase RelE/StbE
VVEGGRRSFRISRQADDFVKGLPEKLRKAVKNAIQRLVENESSALDIRRLLPYPHEFRLRVGKVRVLFRSTTDELFVFKAHYRGKAYKR